MRIIARNQNPKMEVVEKHSNYRKTRFDFSKKLFNIVAFLLVIQVSVQAQAQESKSKSQSLTQQLRGVIVGAAIQAPVEGVTVSLPALHLTAVTDANGV